MKQDPLAINPGELRSRVQILAPGRADAAGQPNAWTKVLCPWVKIATQTASEVYLVSQFTTTVTHIVTMRWTSTPISPGFRIVFGSRVFVVESIENVLERNIRMNIMCSEINGTV